MPAVPDYLALKKATRAIATAPDGRPVIDLKWLPDVFVRRYGKRMYRDLIYMARVPFSQFYDDKRRLFINKWETVQIPLPRFGFEQYVPDSVGKPEWEKQRYEWKGQTRIDWIGPYPVNGWYKPVQGRFSALATHTETCCMEALVERQEHCYGTYRPVTMADVIDMRDNFNRWMRDEPMTRRPDEQATVQEVAAGAAATSNAQTEARRRYFKSMHDDLREEVAGHHDVIIQVGEKPNTSPGGLIIP